MKAQGKTISFDPNLRPVLWKSEAEMVEKLNALAFQADWVLPGLKEGMILTGQQALDGIADFYLQRGVKAVVLKTGADGAWYKTADGEQGSVPPVKSSTWSIPLGLAMALRWALSARCWKVARCSRQSAAGTKLAHWPFRFRATAKS